MFRMRRYRVFLIVAALSAATLYYLVDIRHATLPEVEQFRQFSFGHKAQTPAEDHKQLVPEHGSDPPPELAHVPPPDPEVELPTTPTTTLRREAQSKIDDFVGPTPVQVDTAEVVTGEDLLLKQPSQDADFREINESQYHAQHAPGQIPQPTWQPQKEHNPVPDSEVIKLPRGKPMPLAKVQFDFPPETNAEKSDRLKKLVAIREAFKHAWLGYETYAMPHDELWPVSKSFGDSFMGWGVTMVDSLDSLWIMDLKEEFERAVNTTIKIDFKTSHKKEIPVFETVIRILGGLISAYDISNERYPELLQKAEELAVILMGAFDTPNRMPDMYYKWAPSYASQLHRASTKVVAAEIGSLSMEFTRLAQLTKNDRYYDAIARIQNALEDWQMKTDMPGLWPLTLDASGCKKLDKVKMQSDSAENSEKPILLESGQLSEEDLLNGATPADLPPKVVKSPNHTKRQNNKSIPDTELKTEVKDAVHEPTSPAPPLEFSDAEDPYCEAQGLSFEPYAKSHTYGIASMADSTYEYMPKMYRLLGGLSSQYQSMYENAAKMMREKILFRPMIEDNSRKILFPAQYEYDSSKKVASQRVKTLWAGTHLGCFAGGMFGLAAKTFGIPSDMDIAKQLTDGCVWAYESTTTKIMPESFLLMPCEDANSCSWDEDRWHKALDPKLKQRLDAVDAWNKEQKKIFQQTGLNVAREDGKVDRPAPPSKPQATVMHGGITRAFDHGSNVGLVKRDPPVHGTPTKASSDLEEEEEDAVADLFGFVPKIAMSHDKYVKSRIAEERLAPGFTKILSRSYILRPEAIESVFIMWRLTGEEYWRTKGWKMFQAIQEATHTEAGNAEIEDVTSILGEKIDKMESFWLAETLKYFYLLFSEPDVISLDDFVLNTEAHPFKVPKA